MMVQDYPVTTPFGKVPGYPLNNGFHKGIDYGAPEGTPVVVNGVTIGLVGHTGYVYDNEGKNSIKAAHLHVGRFVYGVVQDPGVGGGFALAPPVRVTTVSHDAANGNYVRLTDGNGVEWVYLHLSQQLVTVGQELKGEDMATKTGILDARILSAMLLGNNGRNGSKDALSGQIDDDLQKYVGQDLHDVMWQMFDSDQGKQFKDYLYNQAYSGDKTAAAKLDQIKKIVG
jgi:hypothetical protein